MLSLDRTRISGLHRTISRKIRKLALEDIINIYIQTD